MNVSRWRDPAPDFDFQPDLDAPTTLALECWMNECAAATGDVTQTANALARACSAMLSQSGALSVPAVALWVRTGDDGRLELLGRNGEFEDVAPDATVVVASGEAWPDAPFFVMEGEGAARDLALHLGLLSEQVAAPSLCVPMGVDGLALLWMQSEDGELDKAWKALLFTCAKSGETLLGLTLRAEKMNASLHGLSEAVADAVDEREPHREGRSRAVAYYGALIAREMGLAESEIAAVEFAALWHALGRLSVPETLLGRETSLGDEERALVRASSAWGARKLEEVDGMSAIAAIVRHQNERFDGKGTPDALSGEEIPLGARVLAVASRFAAMTGRRADRGPLSVVGGAMEDVAAASGEALDPTVVAAFLRAMGRSL
jgi:HD-GYP domain-containing protein (c-di-GMP phosphodiesterase class II)